jgi:hypothetical protein
MEGHDPSNRALFFGMPFAMEAAMITVRALFEKVTARNFQTSDAREFIKTSYYFSPQKNGKPEFHSDLHVVLSSTRPADYHFQNDPVYEQRALHSMFKSFEDAATAIAACLNCRAGEAALRMLSMSDIRDVTLYSRTGAKQASEMVERAAIGSQGMRTGTMYSEKATQFVIVVLTISGEKVAIKTAYPALMVRRGLEPPPEAMDLVVCQQTTRGDRPYVYPSE